MSEPAPDGVRPDADPAPDDADDSITSGDIVAELQGRTQALADAFVDMQTSPDSGLAEADFELELMETIESLAGVAIDHMRKTAGPAQKAAAGMLAGGPTHEQLAQRRARQLVFDRLGSADTAGLLAAGRVFFER